MTRLALMLCALVCLTWPAHAQRAPKGKGKSTEGTAAEGGEQKKPEGQGPCTYTRPGLKLCTVEDGVGSFDVFTLPDERIVIFFDEPITEWVPPASGYDVAVDCVQPGTDDKSCLKNSTMLRIGPRSRLPERTSLHVTTQTVKVAITLRPSPDGKQFDAQVTVKEADRAERNAFIEAEVERRLAERDAALRQREAQLEQRASVRADELVVERLAAAGLDRQSVGNTERAASDDGVVLIGRGAVRLGDRRYFLLAVDNQSGRTFEVKRVKVFQVEGKNSRPLKVTWRFAPTVVPPDEVAQGALLLPVKKAPGRNVRFKVRLEDDDGRAVELGGMQVP